MRPSSRTFPLASLLVAALAFNVSACSKKVDEPGQSDFKPSAAPPELPGPEKLEIEDELVGTGAEAKSGDTVRVHYTGTLMSGKKFDSSRDRTTVPVQARAMVIEGWDEGVVGMKVGGKRKLVSRRQGLRRAVTRRTSPKAALKFDVELVDQVARRRRDERASVEVVRCGPRGSDGLAAAGRAPPRVSRVPSRPG